jgi:hypothetical protein
MEITRITVQDISAKHQGLVDLKAQIAKFRRHLAQPSNIQGHLAHTAIVKRKLIENCKDYRAVGSDCSDERKICFRQPGLE